MTKATIHVPGLKVSVPLPGDMLPQDLVPLEGPAGEPTMELTLEGSTLTARARLNGKSVRKVLKQVAEHGAANVVLILQGTLRPPGPDGAYVLDSAGFTVNVKTPKPAEPAPPHGETQPPPGGVTG